MYIVQAIEEADALKPNAYSQDMKVKWLSLLDKTAWSEVISRHLDESGNVRPDVFNGYNESTDINSTELLIPDTYCDVYLYWLKMQIDYNNEEITKYNNDKTLFNTTYLAFVDYYNSTYLPKPLAEYFRL